ncbi:hypothetical protein SCP_0501820 [Sparassis crispa]|uniref:Uncharacterized protein n=1 Tax=Sparassis crispa TaxID=139825 RepID=A0A401GLS2_9APHY|nr:hypothetical protein SCP_0501820 [Sparassis crispa]GBE83135.1 hypothetical protein SCP_0501820 [Sparassis crispa]
MASNSAPNPNIAKLNAAIEEIENLKTSLSAYKEKTQKIVQVLHGENQVLKGELLVIRQRVEYLEEQLGIAVEGGDNSGPSSAQEVDAMAGEVEQPADEMDEDEKKLELSRDAAESKPIKHSASQKTNAMGLRKVLETVRALGAQWVPTCKKFLEDILDTDLETQIRSKYDYMAYEWGEINKIAESNDDLQAAEDDGFGEQAVKGGGEDEGQVLPVATKDTRQSRPRGAQNSRVSSKLKARQRKRAHSTYTDAKFDSAFITNTMSDDEDDPDAIPGEGMKKWISRAPDYRSDIVKQLYQDIDAIADLEPDKAKAATTRIRGAEKKDSVPPKAKNFKSQIRAWQVKQELLDVNEHWFTSGRVAKSGMAWGDPEDPEPESEKKRKHNGEGSKRGKGKKRAIDRSAAEKSRAELDELLNGEDMNAVLTLET